MNLRRLAIAAAAGLLASAAPAAACSVPGTYRPPTNLELAERADAIVLAVVEGETGPPGNPARQEVIVRPTMVLKGGVVPDELRIRGHLRSDPRMVMTRSDPRELTRPNRDALRGACQRFVFERGMVLLLFLEADRDGRLRVGGGPFARAAEDVPSPDAPWVRATRLYLDIAALPPAERRAALIARRESLRAAAADPDAALLAADIDRQLQHLEALKRTERDRKDSQSASRVPIC